MMNIADAECYAVMEPQWLQLSKMDEGNVAIHTILVLW